MAWMKTEAFEANLRGNLSIISAIVVPFAVCNQQLRHISLSKTDCLPIPASHGFGEFLPLEKNQGTHFMIILFYFSALGKVK